MNKQLVTLLCLLAIVAAAVYYLVQQSSMQTQARNLLFPTLADNATKVERIKITMASGLILEAVPTRTGWQTSIDNTNGHYPVDHTRLAQLIEGLSEAVQFEAKTSRPENYSKLNLADLSNPDSLATLVEIATPDTDYNVLIGSQASSGQGSYARLVDDKQSWLLDQIISLPTDSSDWLRQPILDIDPQQVSTITRLGNDGFTLQQAVGEGNRFDLRDIQPEQSLKYPTVIDSFVDTMLNLNFAKIVPVTEQTWPAEADTISYDISLKDGSVVRAVMLRADPASLIKFEQNAKEGRRYWHGVTYQISNFSAGQLDKQATDFLNIDEQGPSELPSSASIDEGESPLD